VDEATDRGGEVALRVVMSVSPEETTEEMIRELDEGIRVGDDAEQRVTLREVMNAKKKLAGLTIVGM
jgi:hypothetical protein